MLIIFMLFLLFGAKRIPQLAKGLGQAIKELRIARADAGEDQLRTNN